MFHPLHLTRRFFRSVHRKGPSATDETWATDQLLSAERDLWFDMSGRDRRHAIVVARQVAVTLGPQGTRPMIAAALLHDVGKTVCRFGLLGRVVATIIIATAGRARAATWTRGFKRQVALYARHPELGADMLARTGSDPLTIAWAREHHSPETAWTAPRGRPRLAGSRSRIGFCAQSAPGPSIGLRRYLPHLSRREAEVPCDLGRLHACL